MNINFVSARAHLLGAALLSLSFGLSGCGGGGGNGPSVAPTPRPQPTATPTSTVANATYDKTKYTPNYVSALEAAKKATPDDPVALLRWSHFPLSIYFERDANYSTAKQNLTTDGFNRWVKATGTSGVTYTLANSATDADITVKFGTFTGGAGDVLGTTVSRYDLDSRVLEKGTNILIKFTGDRNNDLITASHEFGHALGINEHSPVPQDLMYYTGNDQYTGNITTSDLNTILTSYNGYFNKDLNARVAPSSGRIVTSIME